MRIRPAPRDPGADRLWLVKPTLAGLVLGALLLGAIEWSTLHPRAEANADVAARLEVIRIENARTEEMILGYDAFKREADAVAQQFETALAAVPTEAELASALKDLEGVTSASGVDLVRFTPASARPQNAPIPLATQPKAPDANASHGVTIQSRTITALVRCTFDDYRELLERLASYPRLLTVEAFGMRSATEGKYTIEATIEMKCYFKAAPDGTRPTTPVK